MRMKDSSKTWYGVGFIAGCFDLIHPGYMAAFKEAKSVCTYLKVGLHNDPSIERPEKTKPVLSLRDRKEILQSIIYVDDVITYDTEKDLLSILKSEWLSIDVRFLGDDYKERTDYTGYGLNVDTHFLSRGHGWSATSLREKICDLHKT
jgi:glycerol-3-phosphate cytidylyltransferase